MINMPIIKFEKSVNYLTSQLEVQETNKQLLLDITANLQLMSNSYANDKNLSDLLNDANDLLQNISTNITTIEKSELEITNITNELSNLLNDKNRTSKTKEYYIIAFSNIKNSIVTYTNSFLELQKKLETDNNKLNEFINVNNFKYNFTEVPTKEEITNGYKFTGFSVNNEETNTSYETDVNSNSETTEVNNYTNTDIIDSSDTSIDDLLLIESLSNELSVDSKSEEATLFDSISEDTDDSLDIVDNDITIDDNQDTNIYNNSTKSTSDTISIEDIFELENFANEVNSQNETLETNIEMDSKVTTDDISIDDLINNFSEDISLDDLTNEISADDISIDDLANEISADDISIDDLANGISTDDITDKISTEDISTDNLTDEISTENISTNDLIDEVSSEDVSIDDLTNLVSNEEINVNNELIKTDNTKNEENIIKPNVHYSYSELKDELNKIFDEINGIMEETSNDDTTIETDINTIDDNELIEDIDLSDIDVNSLDFSTSDNSDASISETESINSENESAIEVEDETVNEISDSSFVDNNLKFKEKISNNTFSLIEEEIYDEYSSFELPTNLSNKTEEIQNNISNDIKEINLIDSFIDSNVSNKTDTITSVTETDTKIDNNNDDIDIDIDINDNVIDNVIDNGIDSVLDSVIDSVIDEKNNTNDINDIIDNSLNFEKTKSENNCNTTEIEEKIVKILSANTDNTDLIISERNRKIYLPYAIDELIEYIENYPDVYSSLSDVVEQEFILSFDYFITHPIKARFEETYNLIKNRVHKSSFEALKLALKLSKMDNLNPAIIAACKNEYDLNNYIYHLNSNSLNKFKTFKIYYDINPL